MPAQAGTHDKVETIVMTAVGPGLRRDDERASIDRLRDAAWLHTPGIRRVFAALATTGATSRAVGGAVRNTLLGHAIDDVDIATTAAPEMVMVAALRAGIAAHPTGLQHGTVTLVADDLTFEVTTLRRDVETDGRHATVAFTDNWAEDAGRRDFTINALYCDSDGTLFDPLGGAADLSPTRVRFIGDARARIREDYLRILRFFRFSARYVADGADAEGLAACSVERDGLAQISAERIRVELLKLLVTDRAAAMCRVMQQHGFLSGMLGLAPAPGRLERMIAIEAALQRTPDAILRLAALVIAAGTDAGALARRLRLSGDERRRLVWIAADLGTLTAPPNTRSMRPRIYARGTDAARDTILAAWAASAASTTDTLWRAALDLTASWPPPVLPITGQDVMALGVASGPVVGQRLSTIEAWWIAQDFAPDRAACLDELARLAAPPPGPQG
jgi:poly(A) polymerase